jgi:plasmanylethanolamine desaturase
MVRISNSIDERRHDGSSAALHVFETACVLTAYGLVISHLIRLILHGDSFHWTVLFAVLLAWPTADFVSGLVHWLADTWGNEKMPVIGPRFLRPFRVHHVTPKSFVECGFMDTNGDTALIGIPFLVSMFLLPLNTAWGYLFASFSLAFCVFALPTNQIHQWAHMHNPPRFIALLQRTNLILSPIHHDIHHTEPHTRNYCITSGCCNVCLERIRFFPRLEQIVTRMTGCVPRLDENSDDEPNAIS